MSPRILFLATRAPWPPIGGDRLRTYQLCRALAGRGHLTIVCLGDPAEQSSLERGLPFASSIRVVPLRRPAAAWRVGRALLSDAPMQQALYASPAARAAVAEECARTDVVVAHLLRTLPWLPALHPPLVLCLQDALAAQAKEASRAPGLSGGWRRAALTVERPRLAQAEIAGAAQAQRVTAITERDRDELIAGGVPAHKLVVVHARVERVADTPSTPEPGRIVFFGNLRTASNRDMARWLAQRVIPMVRTQERDAALHIYGVDAPPEVRRLDALAGVHVHGEVDDMSVEVARAWVTACPLRFGSGVQNKVLESLAVGTPVVATPRVLQTLHPDAAAAMDTGTHERSLAVALVELLRDRARRDSLGAAGIAFVRRHHGEEVFSPLLDAVSQLAPRR
ncbi:MAG: glycosyltransferase [Deltaproteobacteria bacterium]|nr:glycosyltransferase [Deltaproteobacteria bacterium]